VRRALHQAPFFARDQADLDRFTVRARRLQALVVFQRQQAQRRQIHAAGRLGQRFHRAVRLARVGGAQERDELAAHAAGDIERARVLGQVDAFLGACRVALFGVALDRVGQTLRNPLEHVLGRLGRLQFVQHIEKQHRVVASIVRVARQVAHEFLGILVQAREVGVTGALFDQRAPPGQIELAPLARLGQHAARRHQAIRHVQAFVAHRAREAQEHAALQFDQFDAACGQVKFALDNRIVVLLGWGKCLLVAHGEKSLS
jgi:hypothetical protein